MARIVECNSGPEFRTHCATCSRMIIGGETERSLPSSDRAFADLDGEPFKAYYCVEHARYLKRIEVMDRPDYHE